MTTEPRFLAPATARNRGPILEVLRRVLPASGRVLEIAAGTGDHAVHFAGSLPGLDWLPTEADPRMLPEIEARRLASGLANLRDASLLAIEAPDWAARAGIAEPPLDAIAAINMVHIAPWAATEHLFAGASDALAPNGVLFLYGPYRRGGSHAAPSNEQFDALLRRHNPAWGVRDLKAVTRLGEAGDLILEEIIEMPSNNLSLVFRRA
jgi:SAM-dependent methyltransferase